MAFVDANVWIGFLNNKDAWHESAQELMPQIQNENIFVTEGIVHETVNFLYQRCGREIAQHALELFSTTPNIEILFLDGETWQEERKAFRENDFSLTDAQIVAFMKVLKDKKLYTFDQHFRQVKGIQLVSGAKK